MNRRKEIIKEYKERQLHGGVYQITNTLSGKYLIGVNSGVLLAHATFW